MKPNCIKRALSAGTDITVWDLAQGKGRSPGRSIESKASLAIGDVKHCWDRSGTRSQGVCGGVYVCFCVYVCTSVYVHISVCVYVCARLCVCICVCLSQARDLDILDSILLLHNGANLLSSL